jgi:hypothetical protein
VGVEVLVSALLSWSSVELYSASQPVEGFKSCLAKTRKLFGVLYVEYNARLDRFTKDR